jgi:acetamidase/formamidase
MVISTIHNEFDHSLEPAAWIAPGDVLTFDCPAPSLPPVATVADLDGLDFVRPHSIVGPIAIEGAEPGDALVVDILDIELPNDYGHCLFLPGRGLLGEDFDAPYVHSFVFADGYAQLADGVRVRLEPFCGLMGNAPAEPGGHSTIPPRRVGGNLDIRDLNAGAQLVLPIEVPGALFSCGDGHAAQGDGEVCLTAIETAIRPTLRFSLLKDVQISQPRFTTPAVRRERGDRGWLGMAGIGDDLHAAARDAVRQMISHLVAERGLTREEAYVLCSIAVDLRISEIVNFPNWVVTAQLPLEVFS